MKKEQNKDVNMWRIDKDEAVLLKQNIHNYVVINRCVPLLPFGLF